MTKYTFLLAFACCLTAFSPSAVRAASPPAFTLIEAEAAPQGTVKADPDASGGRYAARDGAYQPLLIADLPVSGDSFVVWARVRGTTLQLKGIAADGTQKELNWVYDKPAAWKWESFGRHTRAELGAKLLLLQGADAEANAGLDAVVLAADDSFSPDTLALSRPDAAPVAVTVNWLKTAAQATSLSYGLNVFGGFDPETTRNAAYETNMASMNAGILRLHNGAMLNDSQTDRSGWVDTVHQRWDEAKIKRDLSGAYGYGPALLINIPGWPAWMDQDKDGFLDADKTGEYARFCARLVQIVNKDIGRHVTYWEVTNEKDEAYYSDFHVSGGALKDPMKPDRVADLAAIYLVCAAAMKAVDPTIKVGGPALSQPYLTDFVPRFAAATAPHLDFFSFHAYASGSKDDPDAQIFDAAQAFGGATRRIVEILRGISPHRPIPIFLDEYNISWTWETRDPRMAGVKGAVFDALAVTSAITNGAAATAAWNDKDGIYGKMDDDFRPRPGLSAFRLFNRTLVGEVMEVSVGDPKTVAAFAVVSPTSGLKSLLLINRTDRPQRVLLTQQGQAGTGTHPWTRSTLDQDAGYAESPAYVGWASAPISLSPDSLTVYKQSRR